MSIHPGVTQRLLVCYDYGVKQSSLAWFAERGFRCWVVPYHYPHEEVLSLQPAAVLLSNGPGDPATVPDACARIGELLGRVPIMAICMGHQLLARTLGAATYALPFGHHGINHPVWDERRKQVLLTSQNHGFAVEGGALRRAGCRVEFRSLNDESLEGFTHKKERLFSVQFHPEAHPGPREGQSLFQHFLEEFIA